MYNIDPFTEFENKLILKQLKKIGRKWNFIAKMCDDRTEIQLKNQYLSNLKRHLATIGANIYDGKQADLLPDLSIFIIVFDIYLTKYVFYNLPGTLIE